jgi:signal transduction histidine kinase
MLTPLTHSPLLTRILPKSLRWQFITATTLLALLILASGIMALHALRSSTTAAQQLAEERLTRISNAQELMQQALLVERQSFRLITSTSPEELRDSYGDALGHLDYLDQLVVRLAAASDDASILTLHQSSQLFRNTLHLVVSLHESDQDKPASSERQARLHQFHGELQRHTMAMVSAAQELSSHISDEYHQAIEQLTTNANQQQERIAILLACSLLLAWLIAHVLLGRHVLHRLRAISHYLRHDLPADDCHVPVQGADEIGKMARAVEQFLLDRQQLAAANSTLEAEHRRQEELIGKLAQTQNQLLQSEKLAAVGHLAAGIAHEINNPVGFVLSNLGTMRRYVDDLFLLQSIYEAHESELPESSRKAIAIRRQEIDPDYLRRDSEQLLQESTDGLQRVRRIVVDLKDFSHLDESEIQLANLEKGLDSTLNVAWNELKQKAEIVKEYTGIPAIECVPSQINQVFMNLLINAGQAIREHGRITLRTGHDQKEVWVEIEDTGSGIPAEHMGRIFDPFFTTKPVGKGTGLGLSLSYGIIRNHGGRIDVKSLPDVGSTFRVTLPRTNQPLEKDA